METQIEPKWSDKDWKYLLDDMRKGTVIPVVGQELYTLPGTDGSEESLYLMAARKLAAQFELEMPAGWEEKRPLNEVMCAYLRAMKQRDEPPEKDRVYDSFCEAFEDLKPQPSDALKQLAQIRDFRLFATTTPDDLLESAVDEVRFGGSKRTLSHAFMLKPPFEDLRESYKKADKIKPTDLPAVYHLFGRLNKGLIDQFILSDEDLLEFFRAIQKLHDDQLRYLRTALKENHLLFLGGSLSDWLVRFLLRVANGEGRLSERLTYDVLATNSEQETDLLKFLKFFSPRTKLVRSSPREFVAELNRRWMEANPDAKGDAQPSVPPPKPLTDKLERGAVFISYASEDRDLVYAFKAHLDAAGIPVWFDREQLMGGHDWDREIQNNLNDCSFFIPIISSWTQKYLLDVYFRKEWNLAHQIAMRSDGSIVFILPVVLEKFSERDLAVPDSFKSRHSIHAPNGVPPKEFVERLKELVEQRKANPVRR